MSLKETTSDSRSVLVACILAALGLALLIAVLAGQMEWPRLLLLALAVVLLWSSILIGPLLYRMESVRRGQINTPWWLPPTLRLTPKRLAAARQFARGALGKHWHEATKIAGWLHPDHASTLCHLASLCPQGPIVEIGSFRGKSTVFLANGMKPPAEPPHIKGMGTDALHADLRHRSRIGPKDQAALHARTPPALGVASNDRPVLDRKSDVRAIQPQVVVGIGGARQSEIEA
jgi:hypothetical protein